MAALTDMTHVFCGGNLVLITAQDGGLIFRCDYCGQKEPVEEELNETA